MYQISKQFEFSAAHLLNGLPPDHKCSRLHGHNYIVEVVLEAAELDNVGFILDYGDLSPLKRQIDHVADHYYLNDFFDFNPTAENIAKYFFDWCKGRWGYLVKEVRVSETPKTWAVYYER